MKVSILKEAALLVIIVVLLVALFVFGIILSEAKAQFLPLFNPFWTPYTFLNPNPYVSLYGSFAPLGNKLETSSSLELQELHMVSPTQIGNITFYWGIPIGTEVHNIYQLWLMGVPCIQIPNWQIDFNGCIYGMFMPIDLFTFLPYSTPFPAIVKDSKQ